MAARVPARSILKQPNPEPKASLSDEQKAQAERDRRNLRIALQHADRIQHQKNIQAQILSNIETLVEFPSGSTFTPSEAAEFVALVKPFQPSDFDNLVQERLIEHKCGYVLCHSLPRSSTLGSNAAWKLKAQGAKDYCSNDCLRKALYVKTQLSEVPAWERDPGQQSDIVLHENDRPTVAFSQSYKTDRVRQNVANDKELALERGETTLSFRPGQVMVSAIVEKPNNFTKPTPPVEMPSSSHTAIEGHEPGEGPLEALIAANSADGDGKGCNGAQETSEAEDDEQDSWRDLYSNIDRR